MKIFQYIQQYIVGRSVNKWFREQNKDRNRPRIPNTYAKLIDTTQKKIAFATNGAKSMSQMS